MKKIWKLYLFQVMVTTIALSFVSLLPGFMLAPLLLGASITYVIYGIGLYQGINYRSTEDKKAEHNKEINEEADRK